MRPKVLAIVLLLCVLTVGMLAVLDWRHGDEPKPTAGSRSDAAPGDGGLSVPEVEDLARRDRDRSAGGSGSSGDTGSWAYDPMTGWGYPASGSPVGSSSGTTPGSSASSGGQGSRPGPPSTGSSAPSPSSDITTDGAGTMLDGDMAAGSPGLLGGTTSLLRSTTGSVTNTACGGTTPPVKKSGGTYTCAFWDDFSGSSLDSSRWVPGDSTKNGYTSNGNCVRPDLVGVAGGYAQLTVRKLSSPVACYPGGPSSQYEGGMLHTKGLFATTTGYVEFRAKFPDTSTQGLHSALWMLPRDNTYGAWPASGEIDVVERRTMRQDIVQPSLHYTGETSSDTSQACRFADAGTAFHTYAVQWTSSTMNFYFDNTLCWSRQWAPSSPKRPAPFDKPFYLIMNQVAGAGYNAPVDATPFPSTMLVDWVRVWN
ncbi:glycoside hydrolase family 16 protein [Nocardioides jiangxiensis]|uniref:Glycoside hydrolase family 16 protein n=1 Tax=Nocardioides jiangxiensis TaxID=3064524 RepID=A0ABT9B1Z8_9ACTN|nr:glycoside hydrolase family 16 protein [Nocardioides sp. WY-20]MDO7868334.1 glycoside hydrolase family 16 protein [Nocardioides sp. WY-20]